MAFQRALWTGTLSKYTAPAWPCPSCRKGTLKLQKDSLLSHETASSKLERNEKYWDVQLVESVFSCWLKCSIATCKQDVVVSGYGRIEEYYGQGDEDSNPTTIYGEYYVPRFMVPMSDMFDIPAKCPKEIAQQLRASFSLFWHDKSAAAGRVRVALEVLMDHLNIKRRRKQSNGKIAKLTLHQRIDIFPADDSAIGTHLMALKWLGNAGSHESGITQDDLLDAFEILDHILIEIFEQRSKKVMALAKQLTSKHGRRARKR